MRGLLVYAWLCSIESRTRAIARCLALGSVYNYFRDYDPSTGRYVESDPIGIDFDISTYSYSGTNPLVFTDFFGLSKLNSTGSVGGNDPLIPRNLGPKSPKQEIQRAIQRINEALKDKKMNPKRRKALMAWRKVASRGFKKSFCPLPFLDEAIKNWARNQCIMGDAAGCQLFEDMGGTVIWWEPSQV